MIPIRAAIPLFVLLLSAPAARADEPLPPPQPWETCSSSGEYCATLDPADGSIVVYRQNQKGHALWRGRGWSRVAALADDGEHLVLGYEGINLIPLNFRPGMTMLTFYRRGKAIREVPLDDLISDTAVRMSRTASHYRWGEYLGLDEKGRYAVRTAVGRVIRFDMTTGKPVP